MENPYKSPSAPLASETHSSNSDEMELRPSLISKLIFVMMAAFYLCGAVYILCSHFNPLPFQWMKLLPLIPGLGCIYTAFMLLGALWDKQTYMEEGIRFTGFKPKFIGWSEIRCWRQKTDNSTVLIEMKDGRKRYLNNVGLRRDNSRVANYLLRYVGSKSPKS